MNFLKLRYVFVDLDSCVLAFFRISFFDSWLPSWACDKILSKGFINIQKLYKFTVFSFVNENHVESLLIAGIRLSLLFLTLLNIKHSSHFDNQLCAWFRNLSKLYIPTLYILCWFCIILTNSTQNNPFCFTNLEYLYLRGLEDTCFYEYVQSSFVLVWFFNS